MSPISEAGDEDDLYTAFLAASRAFLAAPSTAAIKLMRARYTLYYVARTGSEAGLAPLLASIEANARNILSAKP